jgi:predicted amidohydrolase
MSPTIKIAAIQMDANPAPTTERLTRADQLVRQSVDAGAQLVVLPEIFNTGYAYSETNHRRAEPIDGPTATWMKQTAADLKIHLAGSLMLLDQDEVYNALLLFAPDGNLWRYDKNYPWGWERGYFRDSRRVTVARTELGDVGLMVCWDVAHLDLWRRYAGRVDLMVISSCPPDASNPTFHFPNGDQLTTDDMGPVFASLKGTGHLVFGNMVNQQTAWLNVPAVHTVGSGHIKTDIPNSLASFLLGLLPVAPWLIKYLPQASQLQMSCDLVPGCKIVDANGQVLTEVAQEQGETFTVAEVTLAEKKRSPHGPQPASPIPSLTYFVSDTVVPWLTIPVYRKGLRRVWGEQMAPVEPATRRWTTLLAMSVIASFLMGFLLGRRR